MLETVYKASYLEVQGVAAPVKIIICNDEAITVAFGGPPKFAKTLDIEVREGGLHIVGFAYPPSSTGGYVSGQVSARDVHAGAKVVGVSVGGSVGAPHIMVDDGRMITIRLPYGTPFSVHAVATVHVEFEQ